MSTTKRLFIWIGILSAAVLYTGWKLLKAIMAENKNEKALSTWLIILTVIALVYIMVILASFGVAMPAGIHGRTKVVEKFAKRVGMTVPSETCEQIAEKSLMKDSPWAEQIRIMHKEKNENLVSVIKPQGTEINKYILYLAIFADPIIKITEKDQDEAIYAGFDNLYLALEEIISNSGADKDGMTSLELIRKADQKPNIHFVYEDIFSLWQEIMLCRGKGRLISEKNKVLKSGMDELIDVYENAWYNQSDKNSDQSDDHED